MNRKDLAQVGLKWDPFANEIPLEGIYVSPTVESFLWRVEHSLVREGGYAWIRGDSGNGKSTALRIVDEAQDFSSAILNELRFLASTRLDSRIILAVLFAADSRFEERLAERDLVPMAGRIRIRLSLERATPEELLAHLKHLATSAGNARLMTPELMKAICDHSLGNLRAMTSLCGELLAAAIQNGRDQLDEKLFLELNKTAQIARSSARRPRLAAGSR